MRRHLSIRAAAVPSLFLVLLLLPGQAVDAQTPHDHEQGSPAPYTDMTHREIKALSASEVESLLAGEGMGFARAAELNGVPGPRHVLEMADSMELTPSQTKGIQAVFQEMQAEARSLGTELVMRERHLDQAFAEGRATPTAVVNMTAHIAESHGRLRAVHLVAHLRTADILSPGQVERYRRFRGYTVDVRPPSRRESATQRSRSPGSV